jgi:hypothetical protein
MSTEEQKRIDHLYAILFREAKIIVSSYEKYLKEKLTSKDLAQKMLSLRDAVLRIEDSNK